MVVKVSKDSLPWFSVDGLATTVGIPSAPAMVGFGPTTVMTGENIARRIALYDAETKLNSGVSGL